MKFKYLAVAAAVAAVSSQSFALTVAQTSAAQVLFHLSGSSALQKVVENAIKSNCVAGTETQFKGLLGTPAASTTDLSNGSSQNIYSCTVSTPNAWGAAYNGKSIAIYLNTLGSAFGVFPVAASSATSFASIATCSDSTAATNPLTCTGIVSVVPDAGLSDLEPTAFNDASNHPLAGGVITGADLFPGAKVTSASFASSTIAAVQTFGLVVNTTLYNALQADQGLTATAGVPSISASAFATIAAPGYSAQAAPAPSDWTPLFTNGGGVPSNQVNLCLRLPGSGTRASSNAFFLHSPFSSLPQKWATSTTDNYGTIDQNVAAGYAVAEYDNTTAVLNCVTGVAAGGYAIGIASTDRDLTGTGASFVKLDQQTPNASAAKLGLYPYVYEAYYNVSKGATDAAFANAFGAAFANPTNISGLTAASLNGVMAAVANCTAPYAAGSPCSHVTRKGDSRAYLQYAQ